MLILKFSEIIIKEKNFSKDFFIENFITKYIYKNMNNGGARGYRRRKWTRRHEFKSWMTLIAFHIALIPLGKV